MSAVLKSWEQLLWQGHCPSDAGEGKGRVGSWRGRQRGSAGGLFARSYNACSLPSDPNHCGCAFRGEVGLFEPLLGNAETTRSDSYLIRSNPSGLTI